MARSYVWVLEILDSDRPKIGWEPCAACGIYKKQAYLIKQNWVSRNPVYKFRIKKYGRIEK